MMKNLGIKLFNIILSLVVSISITLVFYLRGRVFDNLIPISLTYLIPITSIIVILILGLVQKLKFPKPNFWINLYFYTITIAIVLNSIIQQNSIELSFRFYLEYLISYMLYFATLIFLKRRSHIRLLKIIVITSAVGVAPLIFLSTQLESIRRVGIGDSDLPISVGHLGPSIAVAIILNLYILLSKKYSNKTWRNLYILLFITQCYAVFLTGSKAAIIGLIIGIATLNLNTEIRRYLIITISIAAIAIGGFIFNNQDKYNNLLNRFTFERFILGAEQRSNSAGNALDDIPLIDMINGRPDRYELINPQNSINYPHNILLSNLLHLGIIPSIIFTIMLSRYYFLMVKRIFLEKKRIMLFLYIFASCNIILINILTSGRITRIMVHFVIFAILDYLTQEKNEGFNHYRHS